MKFSILVLAALLSAPTLASAAPACPMVNGEFKSHEGKALSVSSTQAGSNVVYKIAGLTLIADGKERNFKSDSNFCSSSGLCKDGALKVLYVCAKGMDIISSYNFYLTPHGKDVFTIEAAIKDWLSPIPANEAEIAGIYTRAPIHKPMQ